MTKKVHPCRIAAIFLERLNVILMFVRFFRRRRGGRGGGAAEDVPFYCPIERCASQLV